MPFAKVHSFKVWDNEKGEWFYQPRKSPSERIETIARGEIIPGTDEMVDSVFLDEFGRYDAALAFHVGRLIKLELSGVSKEAAATQAEELRHAGAGEVDSMSLFNAFRNRDRGGEPDTPLTRVIINTLAGL